MSSPTYRLAVVFDNQRTRGAFACLIVGAACIALAPIFVRLSSIGPLPTALWRTVLAVPVLAVTMAILPGEERAARDSPRLWPIFIVAGLMFAGDLGTWHYAIGYTSVADATLFPNTAPVFVAVFSYIIFGTRFRRQFVFGMLIALVGVVLLLGQSLGIDRAHLVGDLLGIATAVFYAGYFIAVARLRARYATAPVMTGVIAMTAIMLVIPTLAAGGPYWPDSAYGWGVLAALAVISQCLGQGLIAYAFAYLPPAFGAVTLLLQPALAAIFAWLLFGEALGPVQALAIAVVLAGVVIARQGTVGPARARNDS